MEDCDGNQVLERKKIQVGLVCKDYLKKCGTSSRKDVEDIRWFEKMSVSKTARM